MATATAKAKAKTKAADDGPKTKRVVIRQASIINTALRRKSKDSPVTFCDINMNGLLNADLRRIMEWDEPGKGVGKGDLLGRLICTNAIFTGKGEEIQFNLEQAGKFKFTRQFDKDSGQPKKATFITYQLTAQGIDNIETVDSFFTKWGSDEGDDEDEDEDDEDEEEEQ